VYQARDPVLDRPVALSVSPKLLAESDTFAASVRHAPAARLQHPNIVTIYELGEAEGTLFIAMELLDGNDPEGCIGGGGWRGGVGGREGSARGGGGVGG